MDADGKKRYGYAEISSLSVVARLVRRDAIIGGYEWGNTATFATVELSMIDEQNVVKIGINLWKGRLWSWNDNWLIIFTFFVISNSIHKVSSM